MVRTRMMRPTESAAPREHVADAPGWWQRVWRRLMPPPSAELILAQLNGQLAVLEGARAELEAGWVQGGWWSVTSADGNQRLVTGYAAAGGGSPDHVDGSCLVGALARGGPLRRPGGRRGLRRPVGLPRPGGPGRPRRAAAGARARGQAGPGAHAHPVERPGRTDSGRSPGCGRPGHQRHDHGPDVRAAPGPAGPARSVRGRPLSPELLTGLAGGLHFRGRDWRLIPADLAIVALPATIRL